MKFLFQARELALSEPVTAKEMEEAEALTEILQCPPTAFIAAVGIIRSIKNGTFGV